MYISLSVLASSFQGCLNGLTSNDSSYRLLLGNWNVCNVFSALKELNRSETQQFHNHSVLTYRTWTKVRRHMNNLPKHNCLTSLSEATGLHSSENLAAGIRSHSTMRALVRLDSDVGRWCQAHSQCSILSQRCLTGLRSELCAGQSSSSTLKSENYFFMDLALCKVALCCVESAFPKLLPQSSRHSVVEIMTVYWSITISVIWSRGRPIKQLAD